MKNEYRENGPSTPSLLEVSTHLQDIPIMDVVEVIAWEQRIAQEGTSLLQLMDRAGSAVAELAQRLLDEQASTATKQVCILCGSGNNGGDGWVAAELLGAKGYHVTLVTKTAPEGIQAEPAKTAALEAVRSNAFEVVISPEETPLRDILKASDLIIDAILGTGFAHAQVRAPFDVWIHTANQMSSERGVPVLSVDCPSGLNAQTGHQAEDAIVATHTVTMLAMKKGLLEEEADPFTGKLFLAPLL